MKGDIYIRQPPLGATRLREPISRVIAAVLSAAVLSTIAPVLSATVLSAIAAVLSA